MSEQVNKEQTKDAKQEKITELSDEQLAEAQGGDATRSLPELCVQRDDGAESAEGSYDLIFVAQHDETTPPDVGDRLLRRKRSPGH